ncbi:MarR family transcriptional regulator [Sphingomonas sp. gentR]|jgi:MarR family transcriptional regulator for hemolysin|uniref:MarR family winged helix-turn-helix transcriptional regulator n=1 Tax=unclassified Sphingomonas TaxID=196159 RepID=UPI0009727521|nr:MarR family transcriptional regulator [Sphingomonas sp. LK11]APX65709.1 MarR family transcriptional regulator [Sphingomonas sp. LK11]
MNVELNALASVGYVTNWAARLFARSIDRELKPIGVASGQLPVFFALEAGGPMTQATLARAAAVEQATMAATLSRMERDGLLRRKPDPADRRSALIELTPLGQDKLVTIRAAVSRINARAMTQLSEHEQEQYLRLVTKIIKALSADGNL